jgi:Double zinc ribbon
MQGVRSSDSGLGLSSFFNSTAWQLFQNLSIALAVCFYLASIWWVFRDARRRIEDPWIVGFATILGLVPLIGPLLYLLVRPLEILDEQRERELEIRALRQRLRTGNHCTACGADSDPSFRFCPVCAEEIRPPCVGCATPLDPLWQVCPFCGTPAATEPAKLAPALVEVVAQKASQPVSQ